MTSTPVRSPATRLHVGRLVLAGGVLLLFLVAVGSWFMQQKPPAKAAEVVETSTASLASDTHYTVPPPPPEVKVEDPLAKQLREILAGMQRMMARMTQMEADIADLKNRKPTTTVVQPPPPQKTIPPRPEPAKMLFVHHELKETPPVSKVPLYTLAPTTYLPCIVETKIVSDVEGFFVCRVSTNVYDSKTRRYLLVPQGSKVLGNDQANELIYGSERMDTVSLTLSLPDGRTVDLGRAPVTDNEGVAGLAGDVNHHWWKLFGAVFIGGALRGGMTAMQTAMTSAAGAGQVATGIGTLGQQATSVKIQPYINIKPTITTFAGQLGNVLLVKELSLPAMWE